MPHLRNVREITGRYSHGGDDGMDVNGNLEMTGGGMLVCLPLEF
jgi:hypothetical protein